eukprot:COSAG02_NODE_3525_length_6615_cov_2.025629_5_plen_232_part_00
MSDVELTSRKMSVSSTTSSLSNTLSTWYWESWKEQASRQDPFRQFYDDNAKVGGVAGEDTVEAGQEVERSKPEKAFENPLQGTDSIAANSFVDSRFPYSHCKQLMERFSSEAGGFSEVNLNVVAMTVQVTDVSSIDMMKSSFKAKGEINFRWFEPELAAQIAEDEEDSIAGSIDRESPSGSVAAKVAKSATGLSDRLMSPNAVGTPTTFLPSKLIFVNQYTHVNEDLWPRG